MILERKDTDIMKIKSTIVLLEEENVDTSYS
jgi:hypothetical protein